MIPQRSTLMKQTITIIIIQPVVEELQFWGIVSPIQQPPPGLSCCAHGAVGGHHCHVVHFLSAQQAAAQAPVPLFGVITWPLILPGEDTFVCKLDLNQQVFRLRVQNWHPFVAHSALEHSLQHCSALVPGAEPSPEVWGLMSVSGISTHLTWLSPWQCVSPKSFGKAHPWSGRYPGDLLRRNCQLSLKRIISREAQAVPAASSSKRLMTAHMMPTVRLQASQASY